MNARRVLLFLCVITVLWATAGSYARAAEPIKIGALIPLTGKSSADGGRLLNATELAVQQINDGGGIASLGGAEIQLVVADTRSRPEIARSEAERLISRHGVSLIMGAWSSAATIPSLMVAERNRIPFIVTSAVTDKITEQGMEFAFRVAPKGSWAAVDVAKFIGFLQNRGLPIQTVAIVFEDGPFGQTVSSGYEAFFTATGIDIVAMESFKTGTPDLGTQAAKLKASGADLVLSVAYVDDATVLLRAMEAQRYRPYLLGYGGGHVHPTLLQLGELAEGTFGIVEWMSDIKKEASEDFVAAYQANYAKEPLSNAAQAYAATHVAALAIADAASPDPVKIRDALIAVRVSEGPASLLPSDILAFDEEGQNRVGSVVAQVIDGQFVTVWPESVASQALKDRPGKLLNNAANQANQLIDRTKSPQPALSASGTLEVAAGGNPANGVVWQSVMSGLVNGLVYSLIAVGLTLIFGVMRVINFAHGEFLMISMYLGYFAWVTLGLDPLLSVIIIAPLMMLTGAGLYGGLIRFTMKAPEINQMAVTLGLSLLLQHLAVMFFTGDNRLVALPRATDSIALGASVIQVSQLIIGLACAMLLVALYLVLRKTNFGLMMQAVSQNSEGAYLSGIDTSAVYKWSMAVGIGTLGVGGPLLVSTLYVNPHVGMLFTLKAFVIVIIGGLGSFSGALVGGIIVGLAEALAGIWLSASFAAMVPFALLIVILLVRPQGIFGQAGGR